MLFTSINVNFCTTSKSSTAAAPRESTSLLGGHTSRLMERLTYSEIGVSKSRLWELVSGTRPREKVGYREQLLDIRPTTG